MRRRRALAIVALLAVLVLLRPNDPTPSITYYSDCTDMSGWEWIFEGCWWRT